MPSVTSTTHAESALDLAEPGGGQRIPVEDPAEAQGWFGRCSRTLLRVWLDPSHSFALVPEPIDHGRVLRYLATLRLPLWGVLIVLLAARYAMGPEFGAMRSRSIHAVLEPTMAEALSVWLVVMVPVGMPLLYFVGGLVAHIGIALTGGAPRSIGASMRAVGYALGPALFAIGVLDLPLYFGYMPGFLYIELLAAIGLSFGVQSGLALAHTHRIAFIRGFVVALLPLITLMAVTLGRAALELEDLPGMPGPSSPYYVP
jgi:hypothetical protein